MHPISTADIERRLRRDNPWWSTPDHITAEAKLPRRVYYDSLCKAALDFNVKRATVLLGPRRVGKTVMLRQLVQKALQAGINHDRIMYVSVDTPVYSGIALESFVELLPSGTDRGQALVIFDEIQYLKQWEVHLKDLVDSYPDIKFVASGSAAAALRMKSVESGAGRFSEFLLPPLTFFEFLNFLGEDELVEFKLDTAALRYEYKTVDVKKLNSRFIDYLNWGGYPEAVVNPQIRDNSDQFIRNDIIDKVLLKDLPSLYGIQDIQELNKLFSVLAYNAGMEMSLEKISQQSQIAKPTITRYMQYLESAFLIIRVHTVDENARRMQRARNFKVYLSNPSMRSALFTPISSDDSEWIGHLAECAIFSQWQHSQVFRSLRYARWKDGEIDIVNMQVDKPTWIVEVKWSDRFSRSPREVLSNMHKFITNNKSIKTATLTSKTLTRDVDVAGIAVKVMPAALYCYLLGRNITVGAELLQTLLATRSDAPPLEELEEPDLNVED